MHADGSDLLFIIGHYKSGSTWLLNMLSLHPDLRGVHETHIFHHATHAPDLAAATRVLFSTVPWSAGGARHLPAHRLRQLARPLLGGWASALSLSAASRPCNLLDLRLRDQVALRRRLRNCGSAEEFCRTFFVFLSERLRPHRYLLEKTPNNIDYVDVIRRIFPGATLIAIYRDGRDVVVSDRFFRQDYQRAGDWSFEKGVLFWRDAMLAQRQAARHHDIVTLSYESLLENGPETLTRLLARLDLAATPAIVGDLLNRSSFRFRTGREPGQEDRRSFNRKGVSGDWRNHFSAEQRRIFKHCAGDLLVELGYEQGDDW